MLPKTFDPDFHYKNVKPLKYLPLGNTDMVISNIGLGAASFGNIYGDINQERVTDIVSKALKSGINFVDTAPWYGQGTSEERLGIALKKIPRSTYYIATKVGRYEWDKQKMFNFSVAKTESSFRESLKKLQLDYVDLIQIHDVEFCQSLDQIVNWTLPTLKKFKDQGLARYIGITGYNLGVLKKIVQLAPPGSVDTVLSYARCNLFNQDLLGELDFFTSRGIGVINASPLGMGLLNNDFKVPEWHITPRLTREACRKAALYCKQNGLNIAKIGLQFSTSQGNGIATTLSSMLTEEQLNENLDAARNADQSDETVLKVKSLFDDLIFTQWENVERTRYWAEMAENGWKQALDC